MRSTSANRGREPPCSLEMLKLRHTDTQPSRFREQTETKSQVHLPSSSGDISARYQIRHKDMCIATERTEDIPQKRWHGTKALLRVRFYESTHKPSDRTCRFLFITFDHLHLSFHGIPEIGMLFRRRGHRPTPSESGIPAINLHRRRRARICSPAAPETSP